MSRGTAEASRTTDNLVLHTSAGTTVWSTRTTGNNGAHLQVQNDGNAVIYSAAGTALWSTGTAGN